MQPFIEQQTDFSVEIPPFELKLCKHPYKNVQLLHRYDLLVYLLRLVGGAALSQISLK